MRTVEFPAGTHRTTQLSVAAVLRAFERRGVRKWTGAHVTRELSEYIRDNLGETFDVHQVGYAIRWLQDNKYGRRELTETGRRHMSFELFGDVALTPPTSNGTSSWDHYFTKRGAGLPTRDVIDGAAQPPLPFQPTVTIYRLHELVDALEAWAQVDREGYARWVDEVLGQLQGATHG